MADNYNVGLSRSVAALLVAGVAAILVTTLTATTANITTGNITTTNTQKVMLQPRALDGGTYGNVTIQSDLAGNSVLYEGTTSNGNIACSAKDNIFTSAQTVMGGYSLDGSTLSWSSGTKPSTRPSGATLVAGDRWYDTGSCDWWVYTTNGGGAGVNAWLSENTFVYSPHLPTTGMIEYLPCHPRAGTYDVYLTDFSVTSLVVTTNTASHYWRFRIYTFNVSGVVATTPAELTTAADSADAFVDHTTAVNTFLSVGSANVKAISVEIVPGAGAPGALYGGIYMSYKLVHR